jgi:molybdopterin converting factor small subunit
VITVRYFAGAAEAAGVESEQVAAATRAELRAALLARHDRLAGVLERCALLADGVRLDDDAAPVPAGATVDVLPPFAGG